MQLPFRTFTRPCDKCSIFNGYLIKHQCLTKRTVIINMNHTDLTTCHSQQSPFRSIVVPVALAWLSLLAARCLEQRVHEVLIAPIIPYRMIAPEVWWVGLATQSTICVFLLTRWRPLACLALYVMFGYWICILANSVLWPMHSTTAIVR
jgi:hypothetical protein